MRRDRGSATVLALGVIAALITLTVAGLTLASAMIASHRARAGADLAALAGASAAMSGVPSASACARAAHVARLNGGRLSYCALSGAVVEVSVEVLPAVSSLGPAVARARAGPRGVP